MPKVESRTVKKVQYEKVQVSRLGVVTRERAPLQKVDFKNLKMLGKFFANYVLRSIIFWATNAVVIATFLIVNAILTSENNYWANSLLIIAPFIVVSVFVSFFLMWKMHAEVHQDGTSLLIFSKRYKRSTIFWAKNLVVLGTGAVMLGAQALLALIFNFAIGASVEFALLFSLVIYFASLIGLVFLAALAQLIVLVLHEIAAIVALVAIGGTFAVAPFISKQVITNESNNLTWDVASNKQNYAKLIGFSKNNNTPIYDAAENVVYDAGDKPQNTLRGKTNNINTNSGFGIFFDKLLTVPYESFVAPSANLSTKQVIDLSKNPRLTIVNVTDEFKSDTTALDQSNINYLQYGFDDANPFDTTYDELLSTWSDLLLGWNKNLYAYDLNDKNVITVFYDRLTSDGKWISQKLDDKEKTFIKKLIGFNKADALIYYLFRDWDFLSKKYEGIFASLQNNGLSAEATKLIKYLFTNASARNNLLKQTTVITAAEQASIFPDLRTYATTKTVTIANLATLKAIVKEINTEQSYALVVDINNETKKMTDLGFTNGEEAKNFWSGALDNTAITLGQATQFYNQLKVTAENHQITLPNIEFDKNDTNVFLFDKAITLTTTPDFAPTIVAWLLLIGLAGIMLPTGYFVDKMKDIK